MEITGMFGGLTAGAYPLPPRYVGLAGRLVGAFGRVAVSRLGDAANDSGMDGPLTPAPPRSFFSPAEPGPA